MPPKKVPLPLQKSTKASSKICEVVFMCEYCLETFPTGTDLLDHKYEDHNVDRSREEDEFAFFNQSMYEAGAESGQITQPKPRLIGTRSPTYKPQPTAACSNSSAGEVNATLTSSIAPTPPTPPAAPALINGHEFESILPHHPELVKAPSSKPKISYSCELCHQIYETKKGLRLHQHHKHSGIANHPKKSSPNDNNVAANNIVKKKLRSNGDWKIRSKISESEIKVTSKKTKVDEPQVKAVPAEATPFQTSSPKRKTNHNLKPKQTFPCKICPKIFSSNDNRSRHQKVEHHVNILQKCLQCSILFTPLAFNRHAKSCDSKFNSTSSSQLNTSLTSSFPCKICQKLFATNYTRCHHEKTAHHGDNIQKCLQCSIAFTPKAFGLHKKECNLKFKSTPLTQSNTSLEPETEPQPVPISSTPVISTQVSLIADKANIDDDSETDYESADDTVVTNLRESTSIPIPNRPPVPVVQVPDSGSETDFEFEFESNYDASQSQNFSIGNLSDNSETAAKNSSIILKDASDKNGISKGTDSHGHGHRVSEKLKCTFCFKEVSSIEERITHEAGHVQKRLFACSICGLHFVSFLGLESHKKRRHGLKM